MPVRQFVLRPDPATTALRPDLALDYGAALDPQQLAAATAPGGATLVVAGAGTGKTRTIVYRLAYLVETGTPADQIALVTFTRRAAHEMTTRAAGLLDGRCARVRGGTFHSLCAEILRRHAERIGFPRRFSILDASDAADVLDLLRTERGLDAASARFPRKKTLHAMASAVANRALPLGEVVTESYPQFARHLDALAELFDAFAARKKKLGLMDYDDLLALTLRLLRQHDSVRQQEAGRLRHVLVDEYQDVNAMQADLVAALASVHGNVTAVGDEAQSIYGFRGASVRHILDFPSRYNGARVLKLERNYRSTPPILDLANRVTEGASEGYAKTLVAATPAPDAERPALVQAPDDDWEARFVAQVVLDSREDGTPLDRMAVLFRASWCSFALEGELAKRGVPFVKIGGLKLAEAAHVKDVVAHLRVTENPADTVAWNRVVRLVEGVGPATARRLLAWLEDAATGGDALALQASIASVLPAGPAARGIARLGELLAALRDDDAHPAEQLDRLLVYYRPLFERVYADDYPSRDGDLDALVTLAGRHQSRTHLLEALALDPLDWTAGPSAGALRDEAPLVLSTIHSAKGLEFDTVFLIHALDGVLPSQYAVGTAAETDEERRLLYVALTRAERHLYVSLPLVQHGRAGRFLTEPSRFLSGLPDSLIEPWTLADGAPEPLPVLPAAAPALPDARPEPPALGGPGVM